MGYSSMQGYANLNHNQLETALSSAISNLEKRSEELIEEDRSIRQKMFDRIWGKQNDWFRSHPNAVKKCWDKVESSFGMFGSTAAAHNQVDVRAKLRQYKTLQKSIDVMNAEPYMLTLKEFNDLMKWVDYKFGGKTNANDE